MASDAVTTESLDYLQRCGPLPPIDPDAVTSGAPENRRLLRIRGIGRPDSGLTRREVAVDRPWRPHTTELLTGLYGYRIPLALLVHGAANGVRVQLGTWSAKTTPIPETQSRRLQIIQSVLAGLYSAVMVEETPVQAPRWPLAGLALGVPAPEGIAEADGSAPIDRIVRSLLGAEWAALVLAYPVAETAVATVRRQVLNEMRAARAAEKAEGASSPLAEQYLELLKITLQSLGEGVATGAWRTAAYLLGDGNSYPRLAAAWRSVFSGGRALPEPVRVYDRQEVSGLSELWAFSDQTSEPGPGHYQRPFEFQTLLTTAQLAMYVHIPELETPGFSVHMMPRFDTVPRHAPSGQTVRLGKILQFERDTGAEYCIPMSSLTRHAFVAGVTGSGKTNTIFRLLDEAYSKGVPFMVIEPAKKEYRALMEHPRMGRDVQVFTAGQATVSPLMLNPFEVPPGIEVSGHIDLLRAVFNAAFAMWGPLPQILERCLHEIYSDRGWDLRTNANVRDAPGGDREDLFPTLSDLVMKVGEVVPTLGYETVGDLVGALQTRLDSLRRGGKGNMLDVTRSLPFGDLLSRPTVIELDAMGDEGDKAFVAGLLLIRLAEHRRAQGQAHGLGHLLIMEEAHRLLGAVPTVVSPEVANPRGYAVETFSNLLSEIRAYGQGVIIADQVPVRLAPDVMKNTDLKVAHRIVSSDDRLAMAGAMAMDEPRAKALTSLGVGQAVVFSSGDDAPLRVQVPSVKDAVAKTPPRDDALREHMVQTGAHGGAEGLFLARSFCAVTCHDAVAACDLARRLIGDGYVQQTLSRIVLSTFEDSGALDRLWEDLLTVLRARQPASVGEHEMLRAFAGHGADWFVEHRGAQSSWSFVDAARLRRELQAVLLDKADGSDSSATADLRAALQATAARLHARRVEPYPACSVVCRQEPKVCMYRSSVADLVRSGRYSAPWQQAGQLDDESDDGRPTRTWGVCQDAAYELIEFVGDDGSPDLKAKMDGAFRRVALCFEQQMLAADASTVPRVARRILGNVLDEAGI